MLGEDLFGYLFGAQKAGMQGFLAHIGKFRPEDMQADVMADAMLSSIAELPDVLY